MPGLARFSIVPPAPGPASAARPAASEWVAATPLSGSTNVVEFSSRLVIQLQPASELRRILADRPLELSRTISPDTFILQAPDAHTAIQQAHELAQLEGVRASYPVYRRSNALHGPYAPPPSDYYYLAQWPLEHRSNGDRLSLDLNVRAAWPLSMGEGVTVAVADTGVELNHQELVSAVANGGHWNFIAENTNGMPVNRTGSGAHGTGVAGLIAASLNDHRIVGVAPAASLSSWAIFDAFGSLPSDERLFDMYLFDTNRVHIQNHSWAGGNGAVGQVGPAVLETLGIERAALEGRHGRGTILVRSAGNDRVLPARADDDAYVANPFTIAVAAVNVNGQVASYSEPGASILVAAPSGDDATHSVGLFTTDLIGSDGANPLLFCPFWNPDCAEKDLSDYSFQNGSAGGFSGTSAAAPHISGVAALMLSINPSLTYRDVQHILALSARHYGVDPMRSTNGAGFLISHNTGFGVPDAGIAANLAREWVSRPPEQTVTINDSAPAALPDDSLRVEVIGEQVPASTQSIRCLPGLGIHPDDPTPFLEIVDVGLAGTVPGANLTNKAALILRGEFDFKDKIANVAKAGAAFAVIYNYSTNVNPDQGGDQLTGMAATDFAPIPAVFVGHTDGERLRAFAETNSSARMRLRLEGIEKTMVVNSTLSCEYVGVRVQANHSRRGDLRITLISPQGTRSVLQVFGYDSTPGPQDWTYWSTHHFYESSAGNWKVVVTDEAAGATGSVQNVSLIIRGTPLEDSDRDGLHDPWENQHFGSLAQGPADDRDFDGASNAREHVIGTHPAVATPLEVDLSWWELAGTKKARLTWPGQASGVYEIRGGTNAAALSVIANIPGQFPETEWLAPYSPGLGAQWFRVRWIAP